MNKLPAIVAAFILFILAGFSAPFARAQAAARVYYDPSSVSVAQNNEFTVQVKIDAEANQVIGSDVVVSYAGSDLEVTAVTNGGYFPEFNFANNASGRIEIHGYVSSTYQSKTGTGTLATVKFKSKKGTGSSAVSFTCAGGGSDTNILTASGQNILSCSQVNQVAVSYMGAGSATNTPTPTQAAGTTATPTPTSGTGGTATNTVPYCTSLTSDISDTTGTPRAVTFTCSGTDPGGDITAAEFVFGDGTSQTVSRNVGSPGSISITHTYTTIGSLGATCKVRDNDQVWSYATNSCKRIITIRPGSSGGTSTGGSTSTGGTGGSTNTTGGTTIIPTPEPTIAVVSIIEETPEPTIAALTPTLYPDETLTESDSGSNRFWWIVGGAISLILAFLLLRRKKGPPKSPPPVYTAPEVHPEPPGPPPMA